MQKTFFGLLLLILLVVFFALENSVSVKVSFWFWEINSILSLIIILSVICGAIVSFLLSLPAKAKKNRVIREKDKKISLLEQEILSLNMKLNISSKETDKNINT